MRIGVIHWGFPPRGGGVEAHLITICPEMVKLGAQVYVLTETMEGEPSEKEVKEVKVIRKDFLSTPLLDQKVGEGQDIYSEARKFFDDFLDTYGLQAVQAHNIHMAYFSLAKALAEACLGRKIPCYPILHNQEFIDRDEEVMVRILRDLPWTKLIPISQFVGRELQKKIPEVPKEKWQVILHGIDIESFSPLTPSEKEKLKEKYGFKGRRVILHPARILRWKGIVPAIKAMPQIIQKFPEALLVLTGRIKPIFKEQQEIKEYNLLVDKTIEDLNLKDQVYIGKYTFKDIPPLTALSDVVIYTTIGDEPFGLCPVEAMASKVPAVVTRSGGLTESVVDGETGFIISKDEEKIPQELASRIIQLFSNPKLASQMGEAGWKRAQKVFDKKRMAQELINL